MARHLRAGLERRRRSASADEPRPRRAKPRAVGFRNWPGVLYRTAVASAHDRVTMSAASLAFHGFLAFFPAVVALIGVLDLVGLSPAGLRHLIADARVLLPAQMANVLDEALRAPVRSRTGWIELVVGVVVALWSSLQAMAALQLALDSAYEVGESRGFLRRRLACFPLLGATIVFGLTASVLLVLGDPLRTLLPSSLALARPAFEGFWLALRWAGAVVLIMLLLSAFYALAPHRKPIRWDWVSPGAIVAAVEWLVVSVLFSVYLDRFGHEARSYGAFAGVAVMLLWLFFSAVAVLFGAELNRELERATERAALTPEPAPAGTAPEGFS